MNKSEIIELVAQKADISKNKAGEAIDAFIKAYLMQFGAEA